MSLKHEKVIHGKNDFLFLGGADSNDLISHITGKQKLSENAKLIWRENIRNIESRFPNAVGLIVPEAHVIYNDFLPDDIVLAKERPVHSVMEITSKTFNYVETLLRNARAEGVEVYTGNDSHWTEEAALLAWKRIRGKLGRDFEFISHYIPDSRREHRDLLTKIINEEEAKLLPAAPQTASNAEMVLSTNILNKGLIALFSNKNAPPGRLLAFCTSFSTRLSQAYAADFREVLWVYGTAIDWSLVQDWAPDEVLVEMPERFLHAPTIDAPTPISLLAVIARASLDAVSRRCFYFNPTASELSLESRNLAERLRVVDTWLGSALLEGRMPRSSELLEQGLTDAAVEVALAVRENPKLFRLLVGMARDDATLYEAFRAVDEKKLHSNHLLWLPNSEMVSLTKIRALLKEGRDSSARIQLNDHVGRFEASAETEYYRSYLKVK